MKFKRAQSDLLWVVCIVSLFGLFAANYELSEQLASFSKVHEPFQVDEMPWTLLVLSTGLAWYSWRRSKDAELEIQERIQSELKVQELLTHNSDLAQRLFTAQEDERRALARELHDEMGQTCTAIRTEAAVLSSAKLPANEVLESAQRIASSAQQISHLTRSMLHRLRPAALDSMGLTDALQALCEQWQRSSGVACEFESDLLPSDIDDYVCVTLYRLLQEGLTNVARHARASQVRVKLSLAADQHLHMRIEDNGCGMLNPQDNHAGFGLLGMRERVSSLGGQLSLISSPSKGMKIAVRLKLEVA
jgi:two-component system sensor histidine kinase UhpB